MPLFSFGQDTVTLTCNDEESYFIHYEKTAAFPGGNKGLMRYIIKNINYPKKAKDLNITGKVYVQYTVDTTGQVTNVTIVRGVDELLDNEAIRLVQSLPKFSPAIKRGKPCSILYITPIPFQLD